MKFLDKLLGRTPKTDGEADTTEPDTTPEA